MKTSRICAHNMRTYAARPSAVKVSYYDRIRVSDQNNTYAEPGTGTRGPSFVSSFFFPPGTLKFFTRVVYVNRPFLGKAILRSVRREKNEFTPARGL